MRSLNPWLVFPENLEVPVMRSLSLQFVIQSLIDTSKKLKEQHSAFFLKSQIAAEDFSSISDKLEQFLLSSSENFSSQKTGILDKLCFYSEILLQDSHLIKSEIPQILDEMKASILSYKAKFINLKKLKAISTLQKELSSLYDCLDRGLCHFFQALTSFLKEARSDENVLILLIENRENLNSFLGKGRIESLLQDFFPIGYAQLRAVIHEGFTRRGFTKFLAEVEPLIDAIERESACQYPKNF